MSDRTTNCAPGRILFMVTSHVSLGLVVGLADYLQNRGWDVHVSSSPRAPEVSVGRSAGYNYHALPMTREIALQKDLGAFTRTLRLIRRLRPAVVVAGTPKASLLGLVAAVILRVPRRMYVMHGLRLEGERGIKRALLSCLEWVTCACATEVIAVSRSLARRAVDLRVCASWKVRVLGAGSANGVDVEFFREAFERRIVREASKEGDAPSATLGYVGRIHPDKGLDLLARSLKILSDRGLRGKLIVVGSDDGPASKGLRVGLDRSGWEISHVGFVDDVRKHFEAMDVLCFPTRREGFGNVVIEASASGVPTVATVATGVPDAMVDGVTGLLVETRAADEFADALSELLLNHDLRRRLIVSGRERVERDFDQSVVWGRWEDLLLSDPVIGGERTGLCARLDVRLPSGPAS